MTDTSYWLFIDCRANAENSSADVREAVAQTLGVMACIFNLSNNTTAENGEQLRPKLEEVICPVCDKGMPNPTATRELSSHEGVNCNTLTPLTIWQPLFAKLLLNESSERVQVCPQLACWKSLCTSNAQTWCRLLLFQILNFDISTTVCCGPWDIRPIL